MSDHEAEQVPIRSRARRRRRLEPTLAPAFGLSLLVHVGLAAVIAKTWYVPARLTLDGGPCGTEGMFAVVSDWEALVPRSGDAGAVNDPAVLPGTPAEPLPSETPKRHELPLIEPVETALGSARSVRALWEEPDEPALILPCSAILEGPAIPQAMRERMEAMPAGADQATVIGHQLRTTEGGAVASGAGAGPAATKDVEPAPATGNSAKGQPATGGGGGGAPSARPTGRGNRPPAYPRVASERGWEGTTIVRAEVLADGTVGSAEVTSSSGHAVLDEAAASAVRQWRFSPALADGKPVRSQIEVPVVFQLEP